MDSKRTTQTPVVCRFSKSDPVVVLEVQNPTSGKFEFVQQTVRTRIGVQTRTH